MPRLILTAGAAAGIDRCRGFLAENNALAAERAGQTIARRLLILETNPAIGRPYDLALGLRELVMSFGNSGYMALYHHDADDDAIYILAIRHQREASYLTDDK